MATKTAYIEGVGRRKTATARVRLTPAAATSVTVNNKSHTEYFKHLALQQVLTDILDTKDAGIESYTITVKVVGGGISAQAEAIRLGIARALVKEKEGRRVPLKREGYLKRDPRSVERKKFGLRKARKRPAWSKR
jgi:small subunit ribosomal protein S9